MSVLVAATAAAAASSGNIPLALRWRAGGESGWLCVRVAVATDSIQPLYQ